MSEMRKVVLVGHCGPDTHMLRSAINRVAPGVPLAMVNDVESLNDHLSSGSLLLINRVLDGQFTTTCGNALIESLAAAKDAPPMMLVSNYHDAQEQAVLAGALRGFGKAQLYHQDTIATLRNAIVFNGKEPPTATSTPMIAS